MGDCCCSVTMCPILCYSRDYSMQGFSVLHYLLEFAQIHIHQVSDADYLILCCLLLLLPSVSQSCWVTLCHESTLCDPMDCSTPGFPVHHQLLELTQTHVHWVGDAIQLSHRLSSPSPPAFNLSQHQGLFQWVSSSYLVAKVLKFQLQHQSFQWIFRTDFL